MINQEILTYIKARQDAGAAREDIIAELTGVGWDKRDVGKAIKMLDELSIKDAVKKIARKDRIDKIIFTIIYIVIGLVFLLIIVIYISGMNSHNSHRRSDASVKANIKTIQAQSELSWDDNGNYNAVCGANNMGQDRTIRDIIEELDELNRDGEVVCGRPIFGDANAYAISAQFREDIFEYYCVDSTGYAGTITTLIGPNDTKCPK